MGTWGTEISSNDTFLDIYDSFFDLYDQGFSVAEISKKLIDENQDIINDSDDSSNFWLALAKAQWESGELEPSIYQKVKHMIENGDNIRSWKNLGASEQDLVERKSVLNQFLVDISKPKDKTRQRNLSEDIALKQDNLKFNKKNLFLFLILGIILKLLIKLIE